MNARSLFLPILALYAEVSFAQSVDLHQRWQAGKKYTQIIETAQQSTIEIGPQKMDQSTKMTIEISIAVRPHEDGKRRRMTMVYDRVAMDMSMNGQKMSFDSANPGTDPLGMGKSLGSTVGKELKILIDEKGGVTEIENYDSYIEQLGKSPIPGVDFREMHSREALTQMVNQGALLSLPEKPIEPGASWRFEQLLALPKIGKVSTRGSYTYKGMAQRSGANCVELTTEGKLTMDVSGEAGAVSPLAIKVTDGTITGTVWFDPQLGVMRESQIQQDMTMSMKNPVDPAAADLTIPMKQAVTLKTTKIEDLK